MKTILVTGVGGFVGSHMADLLLRDSTIHIAGIIHPSYEVQHLKEDPRIVIYREDIQNEKNLKNLMEKINPETIYHLAGMAHVHESWKNRREFIYTNFIGALNLVEACRDLAKFPRILFIGSAECYGNVPDSEQPILESRPFSSLSPYAVSKTAQEVLGIQYAKAEKLPIYLSRSFNHTGPRQKETFVCPAFAKQIVMAELGRSSPILKVGNLSTKRDFSDVRDVVRAYQAILEKGIPGEPYNVCSGIAISIEEMLQHLLSNSRVKIDIEVDPEKFRPADMPLLLGSPEKLIKDTGWKPVYEIHQTLRDLLDYWRYKLKAQMVSP
jgi:GDP-4-dehydro-6-deoxy-D-mannose reductase